MMKKICLLFIVHHSASSFPSALLPEHQIHHPAAADVRSRPAAMAQDVRVATARFRKGAGQFRQPLEGTIPKPPSANQLDKFDLVVHFFRFENLPDQLQGANNLADRGALLMTISNATVLNALVVRA
jgi:hypothetical protein